MNPQPLIAVRDVEGSSCWYQRLLGCGCGHEGTEYQQLVDSAGKLILQLHAWEVHENPDMGSPATKPLGNGVLLWFQVEDFDAAVGRVRALSAEVLEGPQVNPKANHREIWLRDQDGYVVVLASGYGDV